MDVEELINKLSNLEDSRGWSVISESDIPLIKELIYEWADRQSLLKQMTKLKEQNSKMEAKIYVYETCIKNSNFSAMIPVEVEI